MGGCLSSMYMVKAIPKKGDERTLCKSQNYRLAKRTARSLASNDPNLWYGSFYLYRDGEVVEEGAIIKSRISWRKTNVEYA